jgi:hypothetical protein
MLTDFEKEKQSPLHLAPSNIFYARDGMIGKDFYMTSD